MNLIITSLVMEDRVELLAFETLNRIYFEKSVPGRGDDYYTWGTFSERHEALCQEQEIGTSMFYLIRDESSILGRINIVEIDHTKTSGEVGYRIGESSAGQGVATASLKLLQQEVPLQRLLAKTTINNLGSQRVLEKNGFKRCGEKSVMINDSATSFIHYVWEREGSCEHHSHSALSTIQRI
ncbi:ribosomal-protein-alanine N-acetyltransferase [Rossellomorea marisflavi]